MIRVLVVDESEPDARGSARDVELCRQIGIGVPGSAYAAGGGLSGFGVALRVTTRTAP